MPLVIERTVADRNPRHRLTVRNRVSVGIIA
jgi:hypothetical protein